MTYRYLQYIHIFINIIILSNNISNSSINIIIIIVTTIFKTVIAVTSVVFKILSLLFNSVKNQYCKRGNKK